MAIVEKGIPLKCTDDTTHHLIIDMRAMVSIERLFPSKVVKCPHCGGNTYMPDSMGEPTPFSIVAAKLDPANPSMDLLAKFIWGALIHEKDGKTPDEVLDLIAFDIKGITYVFQQLDKAIAQGIGIDREATITKQEEEGKNLAGANSKKSATATSE